MRLYMLVSSILAFGLAATAGTAQMSPPSSVGGDHMRRPPPGESGRQPRLDRNAAANFFVSPAGEPFRATAGGTSPLTVWFAGADTDHDGVLTFVEFRADCRRFFATLDTNHDGEIAPDEVARYESEVVPEIASRIIARYGLIPIPHPIMAADYDFNRGVSVLEFDRAATSRFNLLDEHHVGRLTLEQLQARRNLMLGARIEEPTPRPQQTQTEQPPPGQGY